MSKLLLFLLFPFNYIGVDIIYFRGLPQITVPLPSRREKCRFILKPLTNSVGDLINMIRMEDKGIDHITILSKGKKTFGADAFNI